jgi:hypothetical protein
VNCGIAVQGFLEEIRIGNQAFPFGDAASRSLGVAMLNIGEHLTDVAGWK